LILHAENRLRFDQERLRKMLMQVSEPNFRGMLHDAPDNILHIRLEENSVGPVSIWNPPESNRSYVIGGCDQGPEKAAVVLDRKDFSLCASFYRRCDGDLFSEEVARLGRIYNTALVGTEDDDSPLFQALKLRNYPRLYRHRHDDHFVKAAWIAAEVDDLSALIRENWVCPSQALIEELLSVVVKDDKADLRGKSLVVAAAVAVRVKITSGLESVYPSLRRRAS
jgi:hypothetical protein